MIAEQIHIGIVGFGPKGFYGLERLLAFLNEKTEIPKIQIHLFNKTDAFATGWVYDCNQPDFLVMNYPNQYISLKPHTNPLPVCDLLPFTKWRAQRSKNSEEFEETQIAPRNEVGCYLTSYFEKLVANAKPQITIHKHITTVMGIKHEGSRFKLQTKDIGFQSPYFDSLLLTTGHSPSITGRLENAKKNDCTIPFVYPFSETMKHIGAQEIVSCKGIGLTAIDTILALTEGRSGYFNGSSVSGLAYCKSGLEPKLILPFSRSGIPGIPRGSNTVMLKQTSFYLKRFVENLPKSSAKFDFEKDILPVIKQDIVAAFYHSLFKRCNFNFEPDADFKNLQKAIDRFHEKNSELKRFSADDLLFSILNTKKNQHQAVKTYWKFWLNENKKEASPYVAAAAAWRFLAEDFKYLYRNNLLTEASKIRFQQHYFGVFNRISYGPPEINIHKMIALMDAEILDFSFAKNPTITMHSKQLETDAVTQKVHFQHYVDARLPRGHNKKKSEMYSNGNGLFSFENQSDNLGEIRCTQEGNPINIEGNSIQKIVLYGTPTEGTLFDNDTLSRKHNDTATQWAKDTVAQLQDTKMAYSYYEK
ncbi:FAD/NAD(P)-binding protein [Leeuwenhoekiella marinoflava]|uniref:FAD-NAD(P)-binding protein n=2 Tax=Leeuwenhoekiella marinoflava TaxID=988 RepID=A0A4Q0PM36_9FLAO|nr:FAD/NAD(P)-binding protein [Leeuwenhoekiella marinoflava]RXG30006.1 FAD-NAD(P)-binding protein [Leeuwenhoekiella marinoflava]SHF23653.1 FAD-NAD(P)-binding [Leeuwenhoekiella marinoflava DSM 3653]